MYVSQGAMALLVSGLPLSKGDPGNCNTGQL